jgi:hypothetical protein
MSLKTVSFYETGKEEFVNRRIAKARQMLKEVIPRTKQRIL